MFFFKILCNASFESTHDIQYLESRYVEFIYDTGFSSDPFNVITNRHLEDIFSTVRLDDSLHVK